VRRLQSEVQLLLYPHALNEAREQAGALTLNSFWLSGCGRRQASIGAPPLVNDTLRTPLLADDWAGWADAWRALDRGEIAELRGAAEAGMPVALTLCGERSVQRFEPAPQSWWQRLGQRWKSTEPHAVLAAL
jgi:hypothetical protein